MKQIKDYSDYYITTKGEIYSKCFHHLQNPNCELKKLKLSKESHGYYIVTLCKEKKYKKFLVHRLVAMTYIPNPNNHPYVLHKDDNPSNNNINNLRWGNQKDNMKDCFENGNFSIGEKHASSKLTEKQINWIRENYILRHKEFGCSALSKKFKVSRGCVYHVINHNSWKHI